MTAAAAITLWAVRSAAPVAPSTVPLDSLTPLAELSPFLPGWLSLFDDRQASVARLVAEHPDRQPPIDRDRVAEHGPRVTESEPVLLGLGGLPQIETSS
jgi:hypothetical protein